MTWKPAWLTRRQSVSSSLSQVVVSLRRVSKIKEHCRNNLILKYIHKEKEKIKERGEENNRLMFFFRIDSAVTVAAEQCSRTVKILIIVYTVAAEQIGTVQGRAPVKVVAPFAIYPSDYL